MIISASRRTDIPAYFSDWFFDRLRSGHVLVKNPMNPKQVSQVSLALSDIDGIVFWTKNPVPMLDRLHELGAIPYYFQFTLNPYGTDIEPNVPSKRDIIIPAFIRLSEMIGPERIIWRYDPIILTEKYNIDYHIRYFERLARRLSGYTHMCTFSFLDIYRNTQKNLAALKLNDITPEATNRIAREFSFIAADNGLRLSTCAEEIDLEKYGIQHAKCIDPDIFEHITGLRYRHVKDPNQRAACGCAPSIDIGAYNCCLNGCLYCYANYNKSVVTINFASHDPSSPLIVGALKDDDRITIRKSETALKKSTLLDGI